MADQLTAADHAGHCHASRQHHTLPMQVVCCRPRGHTGRHTSCGMKPASDHAQHFTECLAWHGDNTMMLSLSGGFPTVAVP